MFVVYQKNYSNIQIYPSVHSFSLIPNNYIIISINLFVLLLWLTFFSNFWFAIFLSKIKIVNQNCLHFRATTNNQSMLLFTLYFRSNFLRKHITYKSQLYGAIKSTDICCRIKSTSDLISTSDIKVKENFSFCSTKVICFITHLDLIFNNILSFP